MPEPEPRPSSSASVSAPRFSWSWETAAFAGLIWLAMAAGLAWLVETRGVDAPIQDDWANVAVLTGEQPVTASWLWSQHNEHRVPLPRLIALAVSKLGDRDFLGVLRLNAGLLAVAALGLIAASWRQRGSPAWSDAFFPLVLLHWGHWFNVQIGFALNLVLSAWLTILALIAIAIMGDRPGWRTVATLSVCALTLPLCGAAGVAIVPALGVWLLVAAAIAKAEGRARLAIAAGVAAALAWVLILAYFRGYENVAHHRSTDSADLERSLKVSAEFLANGFGGAARSLWPAAGWAASGLVGVTVLAMAALALFGRGRGRRLQALGMLLFLGGMLCLTVGLGWGRSGMDPDGGFADRYATLAAPALCGCYLAWGRVPWPSIRRLAQFLMFAAALAALWPNMSRGLGEAQRLAERTRAFVGDVASGLPPSVLVPRHSPTICPPQDLMTAGLPMLKRAGVGVFRRLGDDPPWREVPVNLTPDALRLTEPRSGGYEVTGVDPWIEFQLPEPVTAAAARLVYSHGNELGASPRFRMEWRLEGAKQGEYALWSMPTGSNRATTVWLGGAKIDRILIQPDNRPCRFRIHSLTLLVP